jgi:predicted MPP superfamily phosphohydrolase
VVERGGARLAIVGLQDGMALNGRFRRVRFGPGPQVAPAIAGLDPEAFRLGMIHAPARWPLARQAGARLTLAGHTHGGQINLIPGVSSARLLGPYTAGLYEEDGARLYVGRGLGVVGLPMRVAAPAELVIVTLARGAA